MKIKSGVERYGSVFRYRNGHARLHGLQKLVAEAVYNGHIRIRPHIR